MELSILLVFLASVAISFLLSGMEAGLFALSPIRIRQQRRAGNPRAATLQGYLESPEDFLWTIFVGNIVANVLAFAIGVAAIYHWLRPWPVFFFAALLAGVILFYVACELLPKTLFRLYPNRLCMALVYPFRIVHWVLKPVVALMALFSRVLLRWSGGRRFTRRIFGTRDELRILMQESAQGMTTEEKDMINRVLDLQNRTVRQITIPLSTQKPQPDPYPEIFPKTLPKRRKMRSTLTQCPFRPRESHASCCSELPRGSDICYSLRHTWIWSLSSRSWNLSVISTSKTSYRPPFHQ